MPVPPGGPSTIHGVAYQMLRSLLHTTRLHVINPAEAGPSTSIQATLLLEPIPGGGDLQIVGRQIVVEQIKVRSDGGTWSLQEIVEDVLPDLYLAARTSRNADIYRFVTDGRIGDWNAVLQSWRLLAPHPPDDPLNHLNDSEVIRFRRSTSNAFWGTDTYTERRLFERIVQEVRKRKPVINDKEEEATTRANVWRLLARFEPVWHQTEASWCEEINSLLRHVIPRYEDIDLTRRAMLQRLVELSSVGGARVEPITFFQEHGLSAEPLCRWGSLVDASAANLRRELRCRGYDAAMDVRQNTATSLASRVLSSSDPLLLDGSSGCGKSWQLQSIGASLSSKGEVVVVLDARGTADATLQQIAKVFSENVWGQDQPISLERLSQRIKGIQATPAAWLVVLLDDLQDIAEARQLGRMPWSELGIKLVCSGSSNALNELRCYAGSKAKSHIVAEFSTSELHDYLDRCLGDTWATVPEYIRSHLRLPILAHLFVEIAVIEGPSVTNEYQLLDRFWKRLHSGICSEFPTDEAKLLRLVKKMAEGKPYPWSPTIVFECGVDDSTIARLGRIGWLRRTTGNEFEIPHDRLLNWAMAKILVESLRNKAIDHQQLGQHLKRLNHGQERPGGRYLGFTMMDAVWLTAVNPDFSVRHVLSDVVAELESAGIVFTEDLYGKLLPTLGDVAEPVYERRLSELNHPGFFYYQVVRGLVKLSMEVIQRQVERLLQNDNPHVQRVACIVLSEFPLPQFLNQIWAMHVSFNSEPDKWLKEHEHSSQIHRLMFDALCACTDKTPEWIESRIHLAHAALEPVHDLAYLLAALENERGHQIWQRTKQTLISKVPPNKIRSLARCMWIYPDAQDIDWLLARATESIDFVGPTAFGVLARSFPDVALSTIEKMTNQDRAMTRTWWMPPLARTRPNQLEAAMRTLLESTDSFWETASAYQGQESLMSVETLDMLLDRVCTDLESALMSPSDNWHKWPGRLELLAATNSAKHLKVFRKKAGTLLEVRLTRFVLQQGARSSLDRDAPSFVREPGIKVLYKIGGNGYTLVANVMLRSTSKYGRLDGTDLALKRPNQLSVQRCREIVVSDSRWERDIPLEQVNAGKVLAAAGDWKGLINLFERHWPHIFDSLTDVLSDIPPPPAGLLEPIRGQVCNPTGEILPAHVALLGYSQNVSDIPLVRRVLANCNCDSELALSALVSLRRMSDTSPESVSDIARHLHGSYRHLARWALQQNGSDEAKDALLDDSRIKFELGPALTLLNDARTREHAIDLIIQNILHADDFWNRPNTLQRLLAYVRDKSVLHRIFAQTDIRDILLADAFCDEGRSWHTGAKATAVSALATFDVDRAFLAAVTVLRNPQAHDREYYPYLLVEIDPTKSFEVLIRLLETDRSESVAAATGRAMSCILELVPAVERLQDFPVSVRRALLRAVGWSKQQLSLMSLVEQACDDPNNGVRDAALAAVKRLKRVHETEALVSAVQEETSPAYRWVLLDALLEIADPGDQHRTWPEWVRAIGQLLEPFQGEYLETELKRRRKSCFDELKKQDDSD